MANVSPSPSGAGSAQGNKPTATPAAGIATSPSAAPPRPVITAPAFRLTPVRRDKKYLKVLVYGPQGIGKTTLAASSADVPGMADVFIVNAESGDMVIHDNERIKNADRIFQAQATNFRQVGYMYEFLAAHCKLRDAGDIEGLKKLQGHFSGVPSSEIDKPAQFNTVIIDSLTEVEAYNMYALLEINEDKLLAGAADEIDVAEWGEYKKNKMMVEVLVRRFRDLPMHVILVCHETYRQDELKRNLYAPQLTGKLVNSIQGMVDIVGFLRKAPSGTEGQEIRRLLVQPDRMFAAKCRVAGFKQPHFDNPLMADIMKAAGLLGSK